MKKLILFILLTLAGAASSAAQKAVVEGFEASDKDSTAQQYARFDLHGRKCAVVKVRVISDGVAFKGNLIGEPVEKPDEHWVYLTEGTKFMQILSSSFLPFMYNFPEPLQGGVTYVLTLRSPESAPSRANYLVLTVTPSSARVIIDGKERRVDNGVASVRLNDGPHAYRVEALGYATQEGTVTMDGKKLSQNVELVANMFTLNITTATRGTEIYVNGELKGTDSWSGLLAPDTYVVEGRLAYHRTNTQKITITKGHDQALAIPALEHTLGTLNIDYDPVGAAVSIDDSIAGTTPLIVHNLQTGPHKVVISLPGYTPEILTTTVTESNTTILSGTIFRAPDPTADDIALTKEYNIFTNFSTGKSGYAYDDEVVINAKFDEANEFAEGLAGVKIDGLYGFIDKSGELVIPANYENINGAFQEGLAAVMLNGKWGFIDKTGYMVIPAKYDSISYFSEGLAPVSVNDKWGYIDKIESMVIPAKYDFAVSFSEGLAAVIVNDKCGYIDRYDNLVIPAKYDAASLFSEGLASVMINDKYGFIDKTGNMIIPTIYDSALLFIDGMAGVKINDKWGFIDKTGEFVVQPKLDGIFVSQFTGKVWGQNKDNIFLLYTKGHDF